MEAATQRRVAVSGIGVLISATCSRSKRPQRREWLTIADGTCDTLEN
jgi:hypothetical protein